MKNIRIALSVVALLAFAFVLAPSDSLAQEGGDGPCCYNLPPQTSNVGYALPDLEVSLFKSKGTALESFQVMPGLESRRLFYRR